MNIIAPLGGKTLYLLLQSFYTFLFWIERKPLNINVQCLITSYLHDIVPLVVSAEVGVGELQRVEEGRGGSQSDLVTGLVPPHTMNYGCQDLIGGLLHPSKLFRRYVIT